MAQDTVAKFLIAGAGGRHGATGNLAVRQLLARKQPVRAFVFRADERSEHLAGLGAEIVVGDLHDITAVRGAMRSVARAYFTYPLAERLLEATTIFAAAAKEAGVEATSWPVFTNAIADCGRDFRLSPMCSPIRYGLVFFGALYRDSER